MRQNRNEKDSTFGLGFAIILTIVILAILLCWIGGIWSKAIIK